MNLRNLSAGDQIECNVRGRRFFAEVAERPREGTVSINPPKGINYHTLTARQVVRKAGKPTVP